MPADRKTRAIAVGALLLSALALGGCSSTIADMPLVGTPADAPARPKEAGGYLPVHDLPPDREEALRILIEYNCLLADLPMVPDEVHERHRARLNKLWAEVSARMRRRS